MSLKDFNSSSALVTLSDSSSTSLDRLHQQFQQHHVDEQPIRGVLQQTDDDQKPSATSSPAANSKLFNHATSSASDSGLSDVCVDDHDLPPSLEILGDLLEVAASRRRMSCPPPQPAPASSSGAVPAVTDSRVGPECKARHGGRDRLYVNLSFEADDNDEALHSEKETAIGVNTKQSVDDGENHLQSLKKTALHLPVNSNESTTVSGSRAADSVLPLRESFNSNHHQDQQQQQQLGVTVAPVDKSGLQWLASSVRRASSTVSSYIGTKGAYVIKPMSRHSSLMKHHNGPAVIDVCDGSVLLDGSPVSPDACVDGELTFGGGSAAVNGDLHGDDLTSTNDVEQPADHPVLLIDTGESSLRILLEVLLPFTMAGFGCMFAGIVLDIVQHWEVFEEVSEIFILVPALLGLKGNLEMTLASRLSTQANTGHLDTMADQLKVVGGNLALTQVQAVVVGFLASVFAILLSWIPQQKFDMLHGFLLCTSSVITASIASIVLGSMMVFVVLLSRKLHINPDNVATPVGGALGDLTTLALLSGIAMILFTVLESHAWLPPLLLCCAIGLTPIWWMFAHSNDFTHGVLYSGWLPVISAMIISSIGGLILDHAVSEYEGIAVFQPVVNGVGGNLVAVQASRLATALHQVSVPGSLPSNAISGIPNPVQTFFGKSTSARTARVLMLLVIPSHTVFMFTIQYLRSDSVTITPAFGALFLTATVIQVSLLLYIANALVPFLWQRGHDPDNFSIPFLTAIGDLVGGALLALTFHFLYLLNDSSVFDHSAVGVVATMIADGNDTFSSTSSYEH